jgi:hypothetical protein
MCARQVLLPCVCLPELFGALGGMCCMHMHEYYRTIRPVNIAMEIDREAHVSIYTYMHIHICDHTCTILIFLF